MRRSARSIQHGGGYPGYGSQMRWHPATGLGAIVLANSTYASAGSLAAELLGAVLGEQAQLAAERSGYRLRGPVPAPGRPWPETLAARDAVNDLLQDWDEAAARAIFTPNVDSDRPLKQRQADVAELRDRIGPFSPDPRKPADCDSPAHCRWWLTGERGTVAVQIRLAPLRQPWVQQLILALPPAPGSALADVLESLIGLVNSGAMDWPAGLETADGLSTGDVLRRLRIAAAWAGPCQIDCYLAGNGSESTTVRLSGPSGGAELTAEVSDSGRTLSRIDVSLAR